MVLTAQSVLNPMDVPDEPSQKLAYRLGLSDQRSIYKSAQNYIEEYGAEGWMHDARDGEGSDYKQYR